MNVTAVGRSPEDNIDVQLYYDYVSKLAFPFVHRLQWNATLELRKPRSSSHCRAASGRPRCSTKYGCQTACRPDLASLTFAAFGQDRKCDPDFSPAATHAQLRPDAFA